MWVHDKVMTKTHLSLWGDIHDVVSLSHYILLFFFFVPGPENNHCENSVDNASPISETKEQFTGNK